MRLVISFYLVPSREGERPPLVFWGVRKDRDFKLFEIRKGKNELAEFVAYTRGKDCIFPTKAILLFSYLSHQRAEVYSQYPGERYASFAERWLKPFQLVELGRKEKTGLNALCKTFNVSLKEGTKLPFQYSEVFFNPKPYHGPIKKTGDVRIYLKRKTRKMLEQFHSS